MGLVAATGVAARIGRGMAVLFVLWALWPPFNVMLIAVAVFIYMAAGAEYRAVIMQQQRRNMFTDDWEWSSGGSPTTHTPPDDHVEVSPPPYARPLASERVMWSQWVRRQKTRINRLLQNLPGRHRGRPSGK